MAQPPSRQERFIAYLESLADREDRGPLAMLRRGLGKPPGTVMEMYPYVAPWVPDNAKRREENAYYLVAALFGLHPLNWRIDKSRPAYHPTNFGASYAQLKKDADGNDRTTSAERRFVGLLNCHHDDLPDHLRHGVSLLSSRNIPVDWARLLSDLRHWDDPDRYVQRNWARSFWTSELSTDVGTDTRDSSTTV